MHKLFYLIPILILLQACVDVTKNKNSVCEVHEAKMRKRIVLVQHGCFLNWPMEGERENFPNRKHRAGITIGGYEKMGIVYVCPKCNKAY